MQEIRIIHSQFEPFFNNRLPLNPIKSVIELYTHTTLVSAGINPHLTCLELSIVVSFKSLFTDTLI
jgi:hypothetical protein